MSTTTLSIITLILLIIVGFNTYDNYSTDKSIELIQEQLTTQQELIKKYAHKQIQFGEKLFQLKAQTIPDELYQSYLTETEETINAMSKMMDEYDKLQSQHNELIKAYTKLVNKGGE